MKPDIKGLTKLAQRIRRVPKKQFNINEWLVKGPHCGTAGCIAGWAAITFPHRFRKVRGFVGELSNITDYYIEHRSSGLGDEYGFAKGFNISEEDARELVLENFKTKRTPKKAADAIMKLVTKLKK